MLEARGSRRAKYRPREPKPSSKEPVCPSYFPPVARAEWKRIVPLLREMKILSTCDRVALENYCMAYSRFRQAQAVIADKGLTFEGMHGPKKRPEVTIAEKCQEIMKVFCQEFGLTPAARARVDAKGIGPDAVPEDEEFFAGGKTALNVVG